MELLAKLKANYIKLNQKNSTICPGNSAKDCKLPKDKWEGLKFLFLISIFLIFLGSEIQDKEEKYPIRGKH